MGKTIIEVDNKGDKEVGKRCIFVNTGIPIPTSNLQSPGGPSVAIRTFFSECIETDCIFWHEKKEKCSFILVMDKLLGE